MPVFVDTTEALHHVAYYVHVTTESSRHLGRGNYCKHLERMIHWGQAVKQVGWEVIHTARKASKSVQINFMYVFFLFEIQLQRAIFYIASKNDPNAYFFEKTYSFVGNLFSYGNRIRVFFLLNHHSSCLIIIGQHRFLLPQLWAIWPKFQSPGNISRHTIKMTEWLLHATE